jgi:hypothetical protein
MTTRTSAALVLGAWLVLAWSPPATAQNVLVFQDNDPWGYSYWWDELGGLGLSGIERDHTFIATETLEDWDLVIVPSQQPTVFNDTMETHMSRFEDYLDRGGRMILMLASYQEEDPIEVLPFGAVATCDPSTSSDTVHNLDTSHPVMTGVPAMVYASSACELSGFGNADVLTNTHQKTVSSYFLDGARGGVYVSSLTVEWAGSVPLQPIGPDAIFYLLNGLCDDMDDDGHDGQACGGDDCDDGDPALLVALALVRRRA